MLTLNEGITVASPENDPVESLRQILACQQQRVNYEEALEIGNSLIEFYKVLAEGQNDEQTS